MLALVFPGQGSQKRGMGQGLFDEVIEYKSVENDVDALLGYSMRQLCLEDPDNRLKETQYTQPALYVVNALHFFKARAEGARPDYLAGHSLGEYNALLAADAFDFLTGLKLVVKRGELMSRARDGGMAAVIGMPVDTIARVLKDNGSSSLDIANINSASQVVISGPVDEIKRVGPLLEGAGAQMYIPLQVSAAFHSRYMADAARSFADFITPIAFATPKIPVIANVTAQPPGLRRSEDLVDRSNRAFRAVDRHGQVADRARRHGIQGDGARQRVDAARAADSATEMRAISRSA
jgi:malonyl CoA-acyl carrier protein transacylase